MSVVVLIVSDPEKNKSQLQPSQAMEAQVNTGQFKDCQQ